MTPLNIVFMGTPDFSVPCLARILSDGHTVSGVFCQPDKPKGRGYTLSAPPVKELALQHNIPVYQPATLRDGQALDILKELAPDLIVVVAYGKILPKEILELPRLGCVNVHASLLPKLRGAAPIQRCIMNGDTVTGVTTMYMAEGLDTGDMILQCETPIGENETAGELFERLSQLGAQCLSETTELLVNGTAPRTPQDDAASSYAAILKKSDGAIDFSKTAHEICCLVRGVNPAPGAFTHFMGKQLKVYQAVPIEGYSGQIGELLASKRLIVACRDGAVELLSVQPEGKRRMEGSAFICGRKPPEGEKFTFTSPASV